MTENDETALGALEEAMDWLLRLREQPGDAKTLQAFYAWLCLSDQNRDAWAKAQKTWQLMGEVPPVYRHVWQAPATVFRPAPARFGWPVWSLGFGVALAACLLFLFMPAILIWLDADYTTRTAENRRISLEDGTVVDLGAGSAFKVEMTPNARKVVLLQGEAFFDVAHDAARPFTVEAGGVDVTVLGTAFDVQLSSSETTVALARGVVSLSYDLADVSADFELAPGEMAMVDHESGVFEKTAVSQESIGAWRTGRLFVNNVTIASMIEQLQRYHPAWIRVISRSLPMQRITGLYDLRDPDRALRAVVEPFGGRVRSVSPYGRVVSTY
ncbi:FecR family protein [Pararhizobium sp.]|uniref:FecR family protein n=1 Tax=Pararhizobium sp. TaxID=1977563 RepID=UPI00271D53FE|nr:FecR family protein [Pararhizobium sp.]MDO9418127.1 FecR family protein [Pararhizobium sp.]